MNAAARLCLIMPVCNGAAELPAVLDSIFAQRYERGALRLIVVDNGSTDATPEIVTSALAAAPFDGRLVRLHERSIPGALNAGLACAAPDEIVVRLDAHTLYEPDYCAAIAQAFGTLSDAVWCVGGAQVPQAASGFGRRLVVSLMTNPLGLGGGAHRRTRAWRRSAGVYLGAWRPGVLQRLGGYDPRWRANEDAELAERLRAAGGDTWLVPAKSRYLVTRGPLATIRQWGRYGFWRAQTAKRYPGTIRPRHVAPPAGLLTLLLCALSPARPILAVLFAGYAMAVIANRPRGEHPAVTLAAVPFFALAQAAFALGLIIGAVRPLPPLRPTAADPVRHPEAAADGGDLGRAIGF